MNTIRNCIYGKEQSTDEHEYSRDYICAEKYHCGNPTTAKREKHGELTSMEVIDIPTQKLNELSSVNKIILLQIAIRKKVRF